MARQLPPATTTRRPRRPGFFPCDVRTFAGPTSDYQQLPYLRIILQCARVWYQYGLSQVARRLRKDPATGFIAGAFATSIEQAGEAAIRASLGDAIEAVRVLVNRADNVTVDPTLRAKIRVVCGSYIMTFESELGLAATLSAAA